MFSDSIADTVQIDHPKNSTRIQINNDTFELETLEYKKDKLKNIKAFGNINSILTLLDEDELSVKLIVNDEVKYEFIKDDIEELKINNISTNCSIFITLMSIK
jgi:hypothetical protein